ncbi:MAG: hypothetical protein H7333_04200 [Bdellovibrionales bacterium]|nr:hypothetical protein [Oligoflexia bacterium]
MAPKLYAAPSQVNAAEEMLNYFASTCPSQGAWTKAALGKASALVATLQAMKASPECNSFVGSSGRLNLLESQVSSIALMSTGTEQLFHARSIEQEILFMLTTSKDTSQSNNLRIRLNEVQIQISGLETDIKSGNSLRADRETQMLTSIAKNTDDFLVHASNSQACLMKNSSLLSDIARLSGGIASTLTAVNPALSLGIAGGTQLLAKMLEAAHNAKLNKKIRKLNQANDIAAMSCVLESLSQSYCNADDALRAIDWKNANSAAVPDAADGTLRSAVHLMDREIPAFLEWLESVKTSALVSTEADGERVRDFLLRDALLQSVRSTAKGIFTQNAPVLASVSSTAGEGQHWNALVSILSSLMSKIGGSPISSGSSYSISSSGSGSTSVTNPLFSVYTQDAGLYYLVGFEQNQIPRYPTGQTIAFGAFDPVKNWPDGVTRLSYDAQLLDRILIRLTTWYQDASERLGAERLKIVNPDGLNTLTSCDETNWGSEHISACASLVKIRTFLDLRLQDPKMSVSFRRLYKDTRKRLVAIEELMKKLNDNPDPSQGDLEAALAGIYNFAQLNYGSYFLKGRFDSVLRIAFTELFDQALPADAGIAAQSLASHRFMDALQRVKMGDQIRVIHEDIKKSLALNQTTLDKFTDTFGEQIADVLEYLKGAEDKNRPASGSASDMDKSSSFRDERAKICLNLLNATAWPAKVSQTLCEGLNIRLLPPLGPVSETVSSSLINSHPEQRMCRMRDIQRATDIFEFQQK